MSDQKLPTVAESAMRGIACKCPRCGKGKLYSGFLTLRPRCEACGLDYAFIDAGDGPAVFIIMIVLAFIMGDIAGRNAIRLHKENVTSSFQFGGGRRYWG